MTTTGAILLAGGRASRVDGAAKPLFEVGGRSLLQRAVDAVADCVPVTVVAEPVAGLSGADAVSWVREDPPFGGPSAAVVAALRAWAGEPEMELPEWTFLIACDLPGVEDAVARLHRDRLLLPAETEGLCLADEGSTPQWLTGVYRTSALLRGATALADGGRDASLRALLDDVAVAVVRAPEAETADVDTWDDLKRARARFAQEGTN